METALQAAGFRTERLYLSDFRSGSEVFQALAAHGTDAVVYELGERYPRNRRLFAELYDVIAEHGAILLITTLLRWLREEGAAGHAGSATPQASPALQRLVQAIRREIGLHHADS
jgi:hypothetical protein